MTLLRRLAGFATLLFWKLFESGCQVLRRHASSALAEDIESRRENADAVGDAMTLLVGEKSTAWELLWGPGPNIGRPREVPWGD